MKKIISTCSTCKNTGECELEKSYVTCHESTPAYKMRERWGCWDWKSKPYSAVLIEPGQRLGEYHLDHPEILAERNLKNRDFFNDRIDRKFLNQQIAVIEDIDEFVRLIFISEVGPAILEVGPAILGEVGLYAFITAQGVERV